jgi:anaphase-promoting complex subunit 6
MTHQYARAERLLTRPFSTVAPKAQGTTVNGHEQAIAGDTTMGSLTADSKGKGKEEDPHSSFIPRLPMGDAGMMQIPEQLQDSVSRLVDMSVACRYLAAQCQVRQGNWADATEMLGEANPFRHSGCYQSNARLISITNGSFSKEWARRTERRWRYQGNQLLVCF